MSTDTPAQWRMVPVEPTPEMVAAYLTANSTYWREMDEGPEPIGRWRNGTPAEATVESYRAMLAVAPQPAQEPANYAGPKDCPDEAWNLALKVRSDLDRISCPGVYMDKAVEVICKRWSAATTQAAPAPGVAELVEAARQALDVLDSYEAEAPTADTLRATLSSYQEAKP